MANVYTSVSNAVWYTDKCEIVTTGNVSYNIYVLNVAEPITFGGYTVNGNATLNTTLFTAANIVGAAITGVGIAANTTVSSVTLAANSAISAITLSANATANVGNATSYNQFVLTLPAPGNLYSAAPQVAANSRQQIYVGAGNKLTITGSGFTARELGTASSATAGF